MADQGGDPYADYEQGRRQHAIDQTGVQGRYTIEQAVAQIADPDGGEDDRSIQAHDAVEKHIAWNRMGPQGIMRDQGEEGYDRGA